MHRRSGVIAAFPDNAGPEDLMRHAAALTPFPIGVNAFDIPEIRRTFERIIGHAQFLALINIGRTLHHMQAGSQHFGGNGPVLRPVVAEAGNGPRLVMIIPEEAVPGFIV